MPTTALALRRPSVSARHLPHLVFLVAAAGTLVRLFQLNNELCWSVAPPTAALALLYAAGLARWGRLGRWVRPIWLGLLLSLWTWVAWTLPAPFTFGYAWLAVPLALLALRMPTRVERVVALGVITVLLVAALMRAGDGLDPDVLAPPVAAVWATVLLYRRQQQLTRELAGTRGELARQQREAGRLAERARIARDLHDTLAQEIAGSRMLLQAAERDWDRRPDAARRQVRVVTEALGEHLAQTRGIIHDLTPPVLAQDGLESALRDLCARTGTAAGAPRVTFRTEHDACSLPTERAVALLRVTQGLLANAYEHARAAHIQVTLTYGDEATAAVEVRDDGVGFDPAAVRTSDTDRGFGLAAARERLEALGGTLTVDSTPGQGSRVRAALRAADRVPVGAR
ncbi:sensor histidine kinase [Streptomyces fulvoviolaceus]|uniref:sensor histidine kinase n=1 Tax=Streptomyces fulvoviolaceus TaxID=285535 RepID=UPI0021BEA85C|nr:sensor histidine kinase [Streptomyces fulvoviolaceus]MCT9077393.1 sensor histidine kinase [Streptomyces fulvoviolaceus]